MQALPLLVLLGLASGSSSRADDGGVVARMEHFGGGQSSYRLQHTGVIPSSVSVQVGAQRLVRGVGYTVDPATGLLTLTAPVAVGEPVTVSYRYQPQASVAPTSSALRTDAALNLLPGLHFTYATASEQPGLAPSQLLGLDASRGDAHGLSFDALSFSSGPRNNPFTNSAQQFDPRATILEQLPGWHRPTSNAAAGRLDSLAFSMLQSAHGSLKVSYNRVDPNFNFTLAREQFTGQADRLKQLNDLETGKGLQHLTVEGFTTLGGQNRLSFNLRHADGAKGGALQSSVALDGKNFHFAGSLLDIAPTLDNVKATLFDNAPQLESKKGHRVMDFLGNLTLGRGLTFDTEYNQDSLTGKGQGTSLLHSALAYAGKSTKLSLSLDSSRTENQKDAGARGQQMSQSLLMEHTWTHGPLLRAQYSSTSGRHGTADLRASTALLHLEDGASAARGFALDLSSDDNPGGHKSGGSLEFHDRFRGGGLLQLALANLSGVEAAHPFFTGQQKLHFETNPKASQRVLLDWVASDLRTNARALQQTLTFSATTGLAFNVQAAYHVQGSGAISFASPATAPKSQTTPVPSKASGGSQPSSSSLTTAGHQAATAQKAQAEASSKASGGSQPSSSSLTTAGHQAATTSKTAVQPGKQPDRPASTSGATASHSHVTTGKEAKTSATALPLASPHTAAVLASLPARVGGMDTFTEYADVNFSGTPTSALKWALAYQSGLDLKQHWDSAQWTGSLSTRLMGETWLTALIARREAGARGRAALTQWQDEVGLQLEQPFLGGQMSVEAGGVRGERGSERFLSEAIHFVSAQDPRRRIHWEGLYRTLPGDTGERVAQTRLAVAWQANRLLNITAASYQNPDGKDPHGPRVQPITGQSLLANATFGKQLVLNLGFSRDTSLGTQGGIWGLILGLKGKLSPVDTIDLASASHVAHTFTPALPTHDVKLSFAHEVSQENYIRLSAEYKAWTDDDPKTKDTKQLIARLDWVKTF